MDAEVAELVRQDRLLDAARLSRDRGDAAQASALFERACDWRSAASEALAAGDGGRGLELALRAADDELACEAVKRLADDALRAEQVAARLVAHGRSDWAARVLEVVGRELDAARAWERAGEMTRAAALYERARQPADAARVLESALRRDESDGAAAVALGALLGRFGKDEASLRALQRVRPGAPERREALRLMLGPLEHLELPGAAAAVAAELATLPAPSRASLASPGEPGEVRAASSPAWLHGRYEVVRQVASSATARVLEAVDRARGERVALKIFGSTGDAGEAGGAASVAFERLAHELRVLRALDHPAIVPVRDLYAAASTAVFAWMGGGTLDARIAAGPLAPARAAEIASIVLAALGEAHRVGIVHRDIKPSNVLFDAAGAARLADFGAAHAVDASATVTAGDLGALGYQSPEQREGRPVSARSDLFAVGVLLVEMLTGQRSTASARARPSETHPLLDARHDRFVADLLEDAPEARPTNAFQARERLLSLPWPDALANPGQAGTARGALDAGEALEQRLTVRPDGRTIDTWTGRDVECVALTEAILARARAFATVDLAVLQPVLRVDRGGALVWLAACAAPLGRVPTAAEQAQLTAAIDALRVAGIDPGALDPSRLAVDPDGNVVLRF